MSSYNTVEDVLHEIEGEKKFKGLKYPQLLSLAAIQYFVFKDKDTDRLKKDFLTDGKNDGGVDAIVSLSGVYEQAGEGVVIIQSKYTDNITAGEIEGEWRKIMGTIQKIKEGDTKNVKDEVSSVLSIAVKANEEIEIIFMTSASSANKSSIESKIADLNDEDDAVQAKAYFGNDLLEQKEFVSDPNICVDMGSLDLWKGTGSNQSSFLEHDFDNLKGKIVSVSARSLKILAEKHIKKGLLEGNLRSYIKEKRVDERIDYTIENEPDEFWFLNNGITIFTEGVEIEDYKLNLKNFSIVNGGQTTFRLKEVFHKNGDFPIVCKVITFESDDDDEKNKMKLKIASASNTQKRIKPQDQHSNDREQRDLKELLEKQDPPVFYKIKSGNLFQEKMKGKSVEKWQKIDIKKMTRILCATRLARPDEAFARPDDIFRIKDDLYERIFHSGIRDIPFIVDAVRLCSIWEDWSKKWLVDNKDPDVKTREEEAVTKSCWHTLAVIHLAIKEMRGDLDRKKINETHKWEDEIAREVKTDSFIKSEYEDAREKYDELFYFISSKVVTIFSSEIGKKLKNRDAWNELSKSCLSDLREFSSWRELIQDLFITKK